MTIFTTTPEQKVEVYQIASTMAQAGLPAIFIAGAVALASDYEGAYDLMKLWSQEDEQEEKEQICADLEELIDEHLELPRQPTAKPRLDFDQLESVGDSIVAYKKKLRDLVDARGGITRLAQKSGMCQPSLSRFFNSASMPRRTTLYRIAHALDLPETEIVTEWIR